MPRRILLLITDLQIGGTPTVVRELALRLHRPPDVLIEVACLSGWGPVADQLRQGGIAVTALEAHSAADLLVIRRLVNLIRQSNCDTVFSFLVHANAVAAAASLFCRGVRFIQSIQTTQSRPRWHWWVQRAAHHAAEKVVVPSPSAARSAVDWADVPAEKIMVIANAVEVTAYEPVHHEDETHPLRVGFLGRLDPIKRVGDVVDAVGRLEGIAHLEIFGEGSEREAIERRIAQLGIGSLVTLHGAVARPQDALRAMDVLVLPSEAEGFGLVLIEAMAAGVPVVATNVPGIRDVVSHEVNGLLVPVGNPGELAEAIRRVMTDAALRKMLIENGRRTVGERYNWQTVAGEYRRLLGI